MTNYRRRPLKITQLFQSHQSAVAAEATARKNIQGTEAFMMMFVPLKNLASANVGSPPRQSAQ